MEFDFPLLLVAATFLTGFVWLLDALLFAPARRSAKVPAREPVLVEYARSFFPVILAVLVLRSFIVEPFRIPSGSMLPTLEVGDFILVNKFAYGLRLPVLNRKIVAISEPERGDVVVFRYPRNPSVDYIKRVVGVPGDRVAYYNKRLTINGEEAALQPVGPAAEQICSFDGNPGEVSMEQLGEQLHAMMICPGQPTVEGQFVVPEGQYFVMGDNRDNSNDSRFWGTVPEGNLVGKAFMIWFHWGEWGRIGDQIK